MQHYKARYIINRFNPILIGEFPAEHPLIPGLSWHSRETVEWGVSFLSWAIKRHTGLLLLLLRLNTVHLFLQHNKKSIPDGRRKGIRAAAAATCLPRLISPSPFSLSVGKCARRRRAPVSHAGGISLSPSSPLHSFSSTTVL